MCELHGTIFEVACAGCGVIHDRDYMQAQLKALNPHWAGVVEKARRQLSFENAPFAKTKVFAVFCFPQRWPELRDSNQYFDREPLSGV